MGQDGPDRQVRHIHVEVKAQRAKLRRSGPDGALPAGAGAAEHGDGTVNLDPAGPAEAAP